VFCDVVAAVVEVGEFCAKVEEIPVHSVGIEISNEASPEAREIVRIKRRDLLGDVCMLST
jgi:hypothetical protein